MVLKVNLNLKQDSMYWNAEQVSAKNNRVMLERNVGFPFSFTFFFSLFFPSVEID